MAFGGLKGTWTFTANSILASNAATLATGSSTVAVGDLIVVVCGEQTLLTCTGATDTLGNTYSAVNAGTLGGSAISGRCFYTRVTNAGTNTNINVAASASADNVAIVAACFAGPFVTSPLDTQPANNNNTDNTTPFTCPASGTLAQALELVIGWMVGTSGATWTASAPNTLANTAISQAVADTIVGYQVTSTTGTVSPAFAGTNPTASVQGTASFKADTSRTTYFKNEWMGDTPAFTAREYPISLRTWTQSTVANMPAPVATYMPGRVVDWGNWEDPRKPLTHIDFAFALRAPTPPPVDTTNIPGRVSEWGMWERVPFSAAPFPNLTLSLPVEVVAIEYLFREPYYSPQWVGPRFEIWTTSVNIALRAVAPPQKPFTQTDWPLTPAARQPDRTYQRAFPPELIGQDRLPVRQQDWKLPVIADYFVSLRSFLARPGLALITTPPVQPPFAQDDWPVPTARYYDVSLRTFIAINPPLLATSPPPPILMPPLIIEWGISDRIPFQPASIQYNAPLLTAPVVPVQPPFNQDDWPVPPTPQRAADLRTFINDTPIQLIGKDQLPVRQQDWKLPIGVDYSVSLRSFLASPGLPLTTAPVVQAPFSQDDWPVPSAQRQPDRTWQRAFPPTLVGQDQFPIRQKDWPLPVPVAPINDLRTFIGQPQKQPVVIPFRQSDWPVPIATDFSNALRSIGFRSPALDVVAGRPFVQSNWPLTPAASQPDRTFQRSFPPALVGKDRLPIRQQDWPLPIAPRPASDLRTYIAQSPIRLIGKDRLPFRQMHWPVPLAPLEFHTLRSITQGRVIYGGEVAPIPPEPPLPPPEVIHSVRAHADAYYGVSYFDEIKGRADFSRAKGSNDEEAAN